MAVRSTHPSRPVSARPALKTANIDQAIEIDDHSLAIVRRILRRTGDDALARSYVPTCHARTDR